MMKPDKQSQHIIIGLFAVSAILLFLVSAQDKINLPPWVAAAIAGMAASLLASLLFYIVFRRFDYNEQKEGNLCMMRSMMREIGLFRKVDTQYWNDFIYEISTTKEDIIFYGRDLKSWLKYLDCQQALVEKLKNKKKGTKVYFILSDQHYCNEWQKLFEANKIKASIIKTQEVPTDAIACCGAKISVVVPTDPNNMQYRVVFEVSRQSIIGQVYVDYLDRKINEKRVQI